MTNQNTYEYGYELAYKLACEQLARLEDVEQQCLRSGAQYLLTDSRKEIMVEYLNQPYRITLPDIEVSLTNSEEPVPLRDKILILHYLIRAKGTPISRKLITYKELPEGVSYFPTFFKRAVKPIVDNFGTEPHLLADAAAKLGGQKVNYGDIAVAINAFSKVPITFVLWRGDEELPSEGNILFDRTISDYLHVEDINVLCEVIAWRLVRLLKTGGDNPGRR